MPCQPEDWTILKVGAAVLSGDRTRPSPLRTAPPTFFYARLRIVIFETHLSHRAGDNTERNANFEILGLVASKGSGCLLQQ